MAFASSLAYIRVGNALCPGSECSILVHAGLLRQPGENFPGEAPNYWAPFLIKGHDNTFARKSAVRTLQP